jgi:hypothetical protein
MSHLELTDREIERVLAGHQPPGRPDLAEVAYLFARLRTMGDFEQAPPMSPRLLAELDASEVERRPRRDGQRPERPAHARRSPSMRRRWQLAGAAALVAVLGGLLALRAQGGCDGSPAEVASSGSTVDDDGSQTETTSKPETTTTTAPTTTAPPPTEPSTTTTAAPTTTAPPQEPQGQEPELIPPRPGSGPGEDFDWQEWCERESRDDQWDEWDQWCDLYDHYDGDGPRTQSGP